ncbi:MAG TPA: GatB/YqeY domain-containing protein [Candidatus Limnocylindrales bacterium]|jgi:uncharacterized protein YqeY
MSIRDHVRTSITDAMRSGDSVTRDALRLVDAALCTVEKRERRPLTEAEGLGILAREQSPPRRDE